MSDRGTAAHRYRHDAPRIDASPGDGGAWLRVIRLRDGVRPAPAPVPLPASFIDTSRLRHSRRDRGDDRPRPAGGHFGHALKDRSILAIDRVRFVGEPVVAVAADSPAIADEAITLIDVTYEELPAVITTDAALMPDAPHLHDVVNLRPGLFHGLGDIHLEPGNVCYHHAFAREDVAQAFAGADIVVEGEYDFPAVYQYSLEPHTTIAQWME
jgi:CO/xanthine dehydrogenase Mo-binding subunit